MIIPIVKDDKVTVITVTADNRSVWPLLWEILKTLCYSPMCCSVDQRLMQSTVAAALGTIQIMVGLFSIGLGPGRISTHPEDFAHLGAAYWLGGVFITVGIVSIFADRYPSLCSVRFTVFMNIIGSIFASIGIVLYSRDLADPSVLGMCDRGRYNARENNDACRGVAAYAQYLLTGMDITSIILAALQLCVSISFVVLGIKALVNRKEEEQGDGGAELLQTEFK